MHVSNGTEHQERSRDKVYKEIRLHVRITRMEGGVQRLKKARSFTAQVWGNAATHKIEEEPAARKAVLPACSANSNHHHALLPLPSSSAIESKHRRPRERQTVLPLAEERLHIRITGMREGVRRSKKAH